MTHRNLRLIVFILLMAALYSCHQTAKESSILKIHSERDLKFTITTFADFDSDVFVEEDIKAEELKHIPIDYQGFALLTINNTSPYPLIITGEEISINFSGDRQSPNISGSKENEFFYDFYGRHNALSSKIRFYSEALQKSGEQDADYIELKAKLDSLVLEKKAMAKQLPNTEFPIASAILQTKLLEESGWDINSLDALHEKHKEFASFAANNYAHLAHSDQIASLIRQSFMMLEYVNYMELVGKTEDRKADIEKSKELQSAEMNSLVQLWIDALKPEVPASQTLAQCVKTYFNRGMVSKCIEIISAFGEEAKCKGGEGMEISFPPEFELLLADGISKTSTRNLPAIKMVVLVDGTCIFSQIEAVRIAREFEDLPVPVIIIPKGELSPALLALDKLCVNKLYYVIKKDWLTDETLDRLKYPGVFQLGAENKII